MVCVPPSWSILVSTLKNFLCEGSQSTNEKKSKKKSGVRADLASRACCRVDPHALEGTRLEHELNLADVDAAAARHASSGDVGTLFGFEFSQAKGYVG